MDNPPTVIRGLPLKGRWSLRSCLRNAR